ncbi:MAG: dihydroneopterin aldolase [Bacteroidota bacterium]
MGLIEIEGMDFFAYHGCFKEERVIGTRFTVDAWLTTDTAEAELSDDLKHTVNYQAVYAAIRLEMELHSHLLEHVARRIVDALYRDFNTVTHVKIKVSKLNPALAHGGKIKQVSVTLER